VSLDQAPTAHIRALESTAPAERRPRSRKSVGVHLGVISSVHDGRFAFVRSDAPIDGVDSDRDLFVFGKHMQRGLSRGDRVSFNVKNSTRKPHRVEAIDVRQAA
jgi:cold shock CspA family protein